MKQVIYWCVAVLLLAGCLNAKESAEEGVGIHEATTTPMANDSVWSYNEYNSDGLSVDVTNHYQKNMSIQIRRGSELLNLDLGKLKIPWKTPTVDWVNDEFICITNWWSGPFRRCVFIPLKGKLEHPIYIDKDIEYADSCTNIVIYLDGMESKSSARLAIENLISRSKKMIEIPVHKEKEMHALYDSLCVRNTVLEIWTDGKLKVVDFSTL